MGFEVITVTENVPNAPGAFKRTTSGDFRLATAFVLFYWKGPCKFHVWRYIHILKYMSIYIHVSNVISNFMSTSGLASVCCSWAISLVGCSTSAHALSRQVKKVPSFWTSTALYLTRWLSYSDMLDFTLFICTYCYNQFYSDPCQRRSNSEVLQTAKQ